MREYFVDVESGKIDILGDIKVDSWSTANLLLAAYLRYKGNILIYVEGSPKAEFFFEENILLEENIKDFYMDRSLVEPKRWSIIIRELKTACNVVKEAK